MKKLILTAAVILFAASITAQDKYKDKEMPKSPPPGTMEIIDRAGGSHNASNIGLFFENRGKLYPRRITQGPSGEWPINSTMHYIYRVNPMVGIPGNVIQGRYTDNEEWEAVAGYHNRELAKIAFSDNPATWHPVRGWPVKDADGNPVIKSDQDSYCVYSDTNNTRRVLNLVMHQTGYAYGVGFAKDILFFKYQIVNESSETYDSVYFSLYSDIDIGNVSGGDPEYGDDYIGFDKDKNLIYFYDDGVSNEWPGGKTGYFGVAFLSTPEVNGSRKGITDFHYNLYYDDEDQDTIQYGIMSSDEDLYNSSVGDRYFHISGGNLHYDDVSKIASGGEDLVANVASGPYTIAPGDTLTFITAFVAGSNKSSMLAAYESAKKVEEFDFEISKPPTAPELSGYAGDGRVTLYWDDKAEDSYDNFSGIYDFEGYRLYRSNDDGVTWSELASYDLKNGRGFDRGLQYSYTDTTVVNGFDYWYSITAYDRGDSSIASLESPKGNSTDVPNLVTLTPLTVPLGYTAVSAKDAAKTGSGESNFEITVLPVDNDSLAGNNYEVAFGYVWRREAGNLHTEMEIVIDDSTRTDMSSYKFQFLSPNSVEIYNYDTDEVLEPTPKTYIPGAKYKLNGGLSVRLVEPDPSADADFLPQKDDIMSVNFGVHALRNSTDTVIYPRAFVMGNEQSTEDGVIFSMQKPETIENQSRVGGSDDIEISFFVDDENSIETNLYLASVTGNGNDASGEVFISVSVVDSSGDTAKSVDTLYNRESFYFNGLEGFVEFDENNPPSAGNIFSVTSVAPIAPDIRDRYTFSIQGSSVDKQTVNRNMSDIKVVPNPYIVSSLYEPEFGELRQEPLRQLQFIHLPMECTIYIFTVDADLVKTIHHSGNTGTAVWDLRTEGGREIAPGVYIYVVKTDETEYKSRFAVIK